MPVIKFEMDGYECTRCFHKWIPRMKREKNPRICPNCKSAYWDVPISHFKLAVEERRKKEAESNRKNYELYKTRCYLIVGQGEIKCSCGCGCTDIRFLEINHKNGRTDRKDFSGLTIYCAINAGRRSVDDLELTCKPSNAVHALTRRFGLKESPFTIVWNKPVSGESKNLITTNPQ